MRLSHLTATFAFLILPAIKSQGECRIIPPSFLENREFGMAASFLSRYVDLISGPQTEKSADIIRRIKDDGFSYTKGNDNTLISLTADNDFSINFEDGIYYAEWGKDSRVEVACKFPAKVGLMKLENKIGLESMIIEKFRASSISGVSIDLPTASEKEVSKLPFSDFYIKDGGCYVTPQLANKVIFESAKNRAGTYRMLHDLDKYPLESLSNMLITGYDPKNMPVEMTVNQYGNEQTKLTTGISAIHGIFSEEGCVPYWGVKKQSGDMVSGVYLWKNDMGGYCHVISIDAPLSNLASGGEITATLHAYVRLDNLKNLFEENIDI